MKSKPYKKKAPVKKAPAKSKKRATKSRVFSTKHRKRKDVFDIVLPSGHKSRDQYNTVIATSKLNVPLDLIEGGQVKVTLLAQRYNVKGSITLIHDIDTKADLRDSLQYTMDWIFRKLKPGEKAKGGKDKYLRPGNPLNNYINKIIIDFETND